MTMLLPYRIAEASSELYAESASLPLALLKGCTAGALAPKGCARPGSSDGSFLCISPFTSFALLHFIHLLRLMFIALAHTALAILRKRCMCRHGENIFNPLYKLPVLW